MHDELHENKIGFFLSEGAIREHINSYCQMEKLLILLEKRKIFLNFYFTKALKIYSQKISKFIAGCNNTTAAEVIKRITRIYKHIFIDEIQDLAGWELQIIKMLFNSISKILLVGDPRQVVYLTHHSTKYKKYKDGKIKAIY